MTKPWTVAVLGAGAWGTALAVTALRAGHRTVLWSRRAELAHEITHSHENRRYLPGIALDPRLVALGDMEAVLTGADCVLAAVPAQSLRGVLTTARSALAPEVPLVLCAKGIERGSGHLMSQVAAETLGGNPIAALSGPSFATDVASGLPTAVTIASQNAPLAAELAAKLSAPNLRCYSSDDLVGVEVGGALKNVLAIAAGATSGAGLGASAVAAMITRGFVELRRVGAAFGAQPETLMGLSGLGDLILTCSSAQSRNFSYGLALGRGESVEGLPLAEGVFTAGIATRIAREKAIETPIIDAVTGILDGKLTVEAAMRTLLARPLKNETN